MIALRRSIQRSPRSARIGGRSVYAIGDVHGCYDLLHALLETIANDAAERRPGETPLLILLGDYIDRGPASAKVLAALAWLMRSGSIEARLLEGNHEAMLRLFLAAPAEHAAWLDFGGRQTLESYGVVVPDGSTDAATLARLRDALLDAMPASHLLLLDRLELLIEVGDYAFVHAGVMPGVALAKQERDDLLWIREEFLQHASPASAVIVHGHSWQNDRPELLDHRINLDTGAYETGVLTALRLADDEIEVIQATNGGVPGER